MNKLILITGNDSLAINSRAEEIIDSLKKDGLEDYSLDIIHGDNENVKPTKILENLIISLNTPPFFSSNKTIWIKHFSHFKLTIGKDKKNKIFQEILKDITQTIEKYFLNNNDISLIIDGPELDKRTAFYKFFTKYGNVCALNKIDKNSKNYQSELRNKIRDIFSKQDIQISYDAVEFLAETVGSETGRLTGETEKLISYVGSVKKITIEDCHSICSKSLEMANWIFADALANKNLKSSFNALNIIIDKLISEKSASSNPELSMLFQAIRKFQDLIKIKSGAEELSIPMRCQYQLFKSKIDNNKENKENNILFTYHPYRAYKLYEQAQIFSDKKIANIFTALLSANKELVSGTISPRITLENLILSVCAT